MLGTQPNSRNVSVAELSQKVEQVLADHWGTDLASENSLCGNVLPIHGHVALLIDAARVAAETEIHAAAVRHGVGKDVARHGVGAQVERRRGEVGAQS